MEKSEVFRKLFETNPEKLRKELGGLIAQALAPMRTLTRVQAGKHARERGHVHTLSHIPVGPWCKHIVAGEASMPFCATGD